MKHRNVYAMAAWMRGAGAHGGPRKPDFDETEEGLEEYEEEKYGEEDIPIRDSKESRGPGSSN